MMRVVKISLVWLAVVVVLMGCGKGRPEISAPADGQTFKIDQTSAIDVTLADNKYTDTTTSFGGDTARVPEFNWAPIQGTQARVYRAPQQGFGGMGSGQCTQKLPCSIVIIVTRGDNKDVHTIQMYY